MQIKSKEFMLEDNPENVIILAHNFAGFITTKLRRDGYKGRIITMMPDIYIDEAQDHQ
jgi:hypothetical protein